MTYRVVLQIIYHIYAFPCNNMINLMWNRNETNCNCTSPGWLFGDPHIRSADGFRYTFNGLGEYTLLQAGETLLQGRTARVRGRDGRETNATVFCAFAAKEGRSARVHVALNYDQNGNARLHLMLVAYVPSVGYVFLTS